MTVKIAYDFYSCHTKEQYRICALGRLGDKIIEMWILDTILTPNFLNEKQLRDFIVLQWYYWLPCLLKIKTNTFQIFLVVMSMLIKIRFVLGEFFGITAPLCPFFPIEH